MPSANVELLRSIYVAWERGDFSSIERLDPDIEFVMSDGPSPGRWKGFAGMADAMRDWLGAWEEVRQEAEEYRELDSERVLVLHRFSARGKKSGLELGHIRREGASVYHVRHGKVTRIVHYFDRERALADLGLTHETGPEHA
jgi:ketosteroid isomerase-like protein